MKIGILSDTHGYLHPALKEVFRDVDYIFHAGDIGRVQVLQELDRIAPTIAVRGNIDGEELYDTPRYEHRTLDGIAFTLIHNAGDVIRPAIDMRRRILSKPTHILISGHYHGYWCSMIESDFGPVLWLSPGAAGNNGHHHERTALILTVCPRDQRTGNIQKDVSLQKVNLGPREFDC